jgi:predicted nucleic acid-binding protein
MMDAKQLTQALAELSDAEWRQVQALPKKIPGTRPMTEYMLDTNAFNKLLDGEVSIDGFRGLRLVATHVQLDELRATKNAARAAALLGTFEKIDPKMDNTASAFPDVSNWDQSSFSDDGIAQNMLARLHQLNAAASKTHRDPKNPMRDVLIAHTAMSINATLISDDPQLRELVSEFGGRAISVRDAGAET